jgi:hypothetical protein
MKPGEKQKPPLQSPFGIQSIFGMARSPSLDLFLFAAQV